ncbi:MAG: anthranilate phosphoribosyltransferase [Phycisphaeraceae bacterium]|nr:MAG: anthranilate phosphoribosyltransferase [Phycisphaeraceae bacterium]
MDTRATISRLIGGETLSEHESDTLFEQILRGDTDAAQLGAILAIIQSRGATVDEIVGAARAMRRHVSRVPVDGLQPGTVVLDTCGTGGAAKTFNISTCAAIVAASASPGRLAIAKHGNRSRSGRGSAEALAHLGVNVDASPATQAACLHRVGVCFCFAIHHHPAMKHAAGPRASLGVPTIFNLLGPLTNPAGATHQLMGVYRSELVRPIGETLARLGSARALVVHSDDGLDEISPSAPTRAALVDGASITEITITPEDAGLERSPIDEIRAASLDEAGAMFRGVLEGRTGGPRNAVALNAAAALLVARLAPSLKEGVSLALRAIDAGDAARTLDALARVSHEA